MTKRKTYTTDFKQEAASLVADNGYSIPQACEAMGVSQSAMRRWVNQLKAERSGITPEKSIAMTEEHREIQQLKKRIK